MAQGRTCQLKIGNLESRVYSLLPNIIKDAQQVDHNAIINFSDGRSSRTAKPPGFYPFTVKERGNESHGIIIQKKKVPSGYRYYIFDPNGKKWANTSGYSLKIRMKEKMYPLYKTISPDKSWNASGNCGLWSIVMAIIFDSNYKPSQLKKIYKTFDKIGNSWMNQLKKIYIEKTPMQYNTADQAKVFIQGVKGMVQDIINS